MNWLSFLVISLLLTGSLCGDVQPRKDNNVSKILKRYLVPLFDSLSKANLFLPEINLGKEVGSFSDLKANISGGLTNQIDGRGGFGFSLTVEMKNIQLSSRYDIKHLDLPRLFSIFGKGDLEVAIERINLNMVFAAVYNSTAEKFNITLPTFNLSAGTSKVHFESLMDNPAVTEFLNQLISDLVPDLVATINEPLTKMATLLSQYYGNGILYCIKTQLPKVDKCIEDFLKGVSEDELPARLAGIIANVVRKKILEYNFNK